MGANINARGRNGATPLQLASIQGHAKIVKTLPDAGANMNVRDHYGAIPIDLAKRRGHTGIAKLLRDAGAKESGAKE